MKAREEVYAALQRKSEDVAKNFSATVEELEKTHTEPELAAWISRCQTLASSGWRAWELAASFITISGPLSYRLSPQALAQCGNFAAMLSRNSSAPGLAYLHSLQELLPVLVADQLQALEEGARAISTRHKYATKLTELYFDAATSLLQRSSSGQRTEWIGLLTSAVEGSQSYLQLLLEQSKLRPDIDWAFTRKLFLHSPELTQQYIAALIELGDSADAQEEGIQTLLEGSNDHGAAADWLALLCSTKRHLGEQPLQNLITLSCLLSRPALATALAETALAGSIDLDELPLLKNWLHTALDMALLNPAGSEAFVRLESARSIERYQALRGQINLADLQRRLQIFAEGFCRYRLRVGAGDTREQEALLSEKLGVSSNGRTITLPVSVSEFSSTQDNRRWYKMALCHQLAYYEFGSFDPAHVGSDFRYSELFLRFGEPILAYELFSLFEALRVESRLEQAYPGLGSELAWIRKISLANRAVKATSSGHRLFEYLLCNSLNPQASQELDPVSEAHAPALLRSLTALRAPAATVNTTLATLERAYPVFEELELYAENAGTQSTPWFRQRTVGKRASKPGRREAPARRNPLTWVAYRGNVEWDQALHFMVAASHQDASVNEAGEEGIRFSGASDPEDFDTTDLSPADEAQSGARMLAEGDVPMEMIELLDAAEPSGEEQDESGKLLADTVTHEDQKRYFYDEWDYLIGDYRRQWCTLFEIRNGAEDISYATAAIARNFSLGRQVRKQLNSIRPELLRKVAGVRDGEELDLQRAIDARVSLRAGRTPDDNIYVQRQRKERDVSALFLLDMSASTDQAAADLVSSDREPAAESSALQQDYFHAPLTGAVSTATEPQKIIDLEKQAVLLMAEALQSLGDNYAICGFSGYGRDKVEFYVCKDFQEAYGHSSMGRIGGIQPRRSTRMGPAIRHATALLEATESKTKALIIISDGYPQDFDYGADRNSKEYGIQDTTKALAEAANRSVQSFCLTVDPSGHDYLRDMCPDHQYMVMQDLEQLPRELSKIYRGLTA